MTTRRIRNLAAVTATLAVLVSGTAGIFALSASAACGVPESSETAPRSAADSHVLPSLRLIRTLSAPNEHYPFFNLVSGTSNLTWSPDGERLAAYVRYGTAITVWSPDGKVQHEIPRYNAAALTSANVLGFVSGHSQLITGPAAPDPSHLSVIDDVAFSILDADTGKVVHNVVGLNPGKSFRENIVSQAAISPDQRFVAVIYNVIFDRSVDRRIGIYATDNWQRIAAIPFGEEGEFPRADAIAFSPDGKLFAVAYENKFGNNCRVDIFDVRSWKRIQSIKTFPDAPPKTLMITAAVRFSPDGSKIAVNLAGGGLTNRYPNGQVAPKGAGKLIPTDVPEPLRIFRISDGARLASAGGFVDGGFAKTTDWSPTRNLIAFLDVYKDLFLWDPTSGLPPYEACDWPRTTTAVSFSSNGKLLGQGFGDGVNLYEILDH